MIEISKEEFENSILDLINRKITRVELAKKLHTDTRTLVNMIYQIDNEQLLKQYIEIYPYKPKENKNINYESLVIEMIKNAMSAKDMQSKYDIAERTYTRNINKLKQSNDRLYKIYKSYIKGYLSSEDMEYINEMSKEKVIYTTNIQERKAELMYLFMKYEELLQQGLNKEQASQKLNESSKSLKRKSDELERILKEESINSKNGDNFKESIKVENLEQRGKIQSTTPEIAQGIEETEK